MHFLFTAVLALLSCESAYAVSKKVIHYEGVARTISLPSGVEQLQPLLLAKTLDPSADLIIEIACVKESNNQIRLSTVYMKVNGNKLTISDSMGAPKYLSGTGEATGEAWNWSFFKFSMDAGPVRIEDVNFAVPGKLIARKQIFLKATDQPVMLWEVEMSETSEEKFQSAYKAMNCPKQ